MVIFIGLMELVRDVHLFSKQVLQSVMAILTQLTCIELVIEVVSQFSFKGLGYLVVIKWGHTKEVRRYGNTTGHGLQGVGSRAPQF